MLVARCCDLPAAAVLSCSAPALCRPPARRRRRAEETRSLLAGRSSRWVGPGVVGLRVLSNLPPLENMFGPGASINRPKKNISFSGKLCVIYSLKKAIYFHSTTAPQLTGAGKICRKNAMLDVQASVITAIV